jgi:hypothetical protein
MSGLGAINLARRRLPGFVLAASLAGVALVACLATTVLSDVYAGAPPSIPVSAITALCRPVPGVADCEAGVVRLNPGRFYVRTRGPASSVTIVVHDRAAVARSQVLLMQADARGHVIVDSETAVPNAVSFGSEVREAGSRSVVVVPRPAPAWNRITFAPASAGAGPIAISELGFFASDEGLLRPTIYPFRRPAAESFYSTVVPAAVAAVCAFLIAAAWLAPDTMRRPIPWLLAVMCVSVAVLELGTMFSPYWSRDLRSMYGAELIFSPPGTNLGGGLEEASRLVQGLGQTVAPGFVQWHRMPGYGLFCAVAALAGRTTDEVEIAMHVIVLQVILYGVAVGLFVGVARRVFPLQLACLLGVLVTLLPKQLGLTAVDSVVASLSLILLAALLACFADSRTGEPVPLSAFLWVQIAFALWFAMRNDVLPGWIVVSVVVAGKRWRRLVVPVALAAAIALPWAVYKRQYRHEFNLLPTNSGEVLLLSLCEVPGAFPYECSDAGYFEWAKRAGHPDPSAQQTSNLAVAEVVRHWVTYPVHFGLMVTTKLRRALFAEGWPGFRSRFNLLYAQPAQRAGLFAGLLTAVLLSLAVNHERRRSFLLGWALFLNMPIFFIVFESAGRFYAPAGTSLIVAAVPLLFERGFYGQVARHPRRAAAVIACVGLFVAGGPRVENWVRANDSVHYWAPVLNPAGSTLEFVTP